MKRKELEKRLNRLDKEHNATAIWSEGGSHSKVAIQGVETTVPRHSEINELTARGIIRYFERNLK
ncbi:hypothetical protein [Bifidobacterium dentium]|uniref:hypothetical protein n=1 Tax=Bifidobacterium dentium TaxID=1689 RepID=UPI0018B073D9|nr:hypothetical protein [Bifidobacterium dentium]MBF9670359.1 hypothetical protein [Bifidobacterium dentium]